MTIIAKDDTTVMQSGNNIMAKEGIYTLIGNMLVGPGGFVSTNVGSIQEAAGIVAGLHGGRKL